MKIICKKHSEREIWMPSGDRIRVQHNTLIHFKWKEQSMSIKLMTLKPYTGKYHSMSNDWCA